MLTEEEWRLVAEALVALAFDDYPEQDTLAAIVGAWGRATPRQLDAIRKYEASL